MCHISVRLARLLRIRSTFSLPVCPVHWHRTPAQNCFAFCARWGMNPHPVRDTILSRACIPKDYISHHPMVESTILLCPDRAIFHYMNCTCVTSQFVSCETSSIRSTFSIPARPVHLAQGSSAKLLRIFCARGGNRTYISVRDTI